MFQRRGASPPYPNQQTERWLAWLAWQMVHHGLSAFYIEQMQPDWLPQQQHRALTTGVGLLGGLYIGLIFGLGAGSHVGILYGLLGGLGAGLTYGGLACLRHFELRLFLVCQGTAPWRYADFLDYAAERLFLRKVGGGYSFIHRLLQDYFAMHYMGSGNGAHSETAGQRQSAAS